MASLSLCFFVFTVSALFPSLTAQPQASSDYTKLVFKGCADQKFQDPTGSYSRNLKALYASLLPQSAEKPFAAASAGDGPNSVSGSYQCRGDLATAQCSACVAKTPAAAAELCGADAAAARVQLRGCALHYEVAGFRQVSETQLLYKSCGSIAAQGSGFEERRETAFGMVEDGVASGTGLFYTGTYQSVYVLGQCEGDLEADDCRSCVKTAAEKAKSVCGGSISGQVYLQKCYVSYSYYPNGVPGISSEGDKGTTGKSHTQRTVAIAVGGVAALGFLIVCLLFMRSVMKKHGGSKHRG